MPDNLQRPRRHHSRSVGLAILCAAGAPALVVFPFGSIFFALPAFIVALLHTLVLGFPVYCLFRRFRWVNAGTAAAAGFVVGAVPLLLFEASLSPGFAAGTHRDLSNGFLMLGDVVVDLRGPAFFGAFGAIGGVAFWLALRLTGAFDKKDPDISCF